MAAVGSVVGVVLAVVCAAASFVAHAHPDAALAVVARWMGQGEALDQGRLPQADEERLMWMIRGARWPLTGLVFGASFVAGATLAWSMG